MDLRAFVGSSGTVPQPAREESKALCLADEEHKKNVKKRADGVDDTAGMQNKMSLWGNFTEVVPHSSVQNPRAARNCLAFWDAIGTPCRSRRRRIGISFEKQYCYLNVFYALTSNFQILARPRMDRSASDNDVTKWLPWGFVGLTRHRGKDSRSKPI